MRAAIGALQKAEISPTWEGIGAVDPLLVRTFASALWNKEAAVVTNIMVSSVEAGTTNQLLHQLGPLLLEAVSTGEEPAYWSKVVQAVYVARKNDSVSRALLLADLLSYIKGV